MRHVFRFIGIVALLAFTAGPAAAQDTSDVYVVHGIPGVDVDVYVDGALTLEGFAPKDIAGPLALPAATYDIEIFAAADDPAAAAADRDDDAVISVSPAVPGGANLSVVAHLDGSGAPTVTAFVNDVTPAGAGNGRLTVRHTAAAPVVDIVAGGASVPPFVNLANGGEAKADLPAADYPTGIAAAGTTEALVDAPVTVVEGENLVVYAIGDFAGGTFELLTQNFDGLHSAPTAVNSGNSGLAAASTSSAAGLLVGGIAALAIASGSGLVLARRRV
jgi:hypothetical protein